MIIQAIRMKRYVSEKGLEKAKLKTEKMLRSKSSGRREGEFRLRFSKCKVRTGKAKTSFALEWLLTSKTHMTTRTRFQRRAWFAIGLLVSASFLTAIALANGLVPQEAANSTSGHGKAALEKSVRPETQIQTVDSKSRPIESQGRGYIKSDSCRQCHAEHYDTWHCLLYTSPSPRDGLLSRMPSSA